MVPISKKRHRLYNYEIPVVQGLLPYLEELFKEDEEKAKIVFRTLYRLVFVEKGRPKYPEFSWSQAEVFLKMKKN
jgi:hypothetical protein